MKLKFIADAYYNGEHKYKKGQIAVVPTEKGEANRWLSRGIAIEVKEVELEVKAEVPVEVKEEAVEVSVEEVQVEVPKKRTKKKE
jgi:hypothetical protein